MTDIKEDGEFFSGKKEEYNEKTLACIRQAIGKLDEIDNRPLMMLEKFKCISNADNS